MSDRDWPQDFADENGNYECKCILCGERFVGYKRRLICRICATDAFEAEEQAIAVMRCAEALEEWMETESFKHPDNRSPMPEICGNRDRLRKG